MIKGIKMEENKRLIFILVLVIIFSVLGFIFLKTDNQRLNKIKENILETKRIKVYGIDNEEYVFKKTIADIDDINKIISIINNTYVSNNEVDVAKPVNESYKLEFFTDDDAIIVDIIVEGYYLHSDGVQFKFASDEDKESFENLIID